jgi:serine/threonine-protein kinase
MDFPPKNLSSFHSDILEQTQLGRMCGSQELFRDRYQILRMLGRGGFGVTFLAKDAYLPSQPQCVIKQLCPRFTDYPALVSARERFEREAKTLSLLGSHSQIPRLLDYFSIDEEFYLVQEYVRGYTLARLIRRIGPISEAAVKKLLGEMLPLLQYIHQNRVIHRDIKPQNVIRCQDDGRLVLIDFGAVKEIAQFGDTGGKTATTNFIGTVGFAPPEQFALRPVYASDIYALGVTCLYLLTGKAPLDFESNRRSGEIIWRNTVDVSEPFAQILDRMLVISLQERYQSAGAILRSLNKEVPQDNLANCLTVQSPPAKLSDQTKPELSASEYDSPAHRTASAIRDWKKRLEARKQRQKIREIKDILRNSGSSV